MLWLCAAAAFPAARKEDSHKELVRRLDAILGAADVARGFWGVEIEDLDSGQVLYSRDGDRLFSPASNMKLFTTATALGLIGPDYQFRTTIESAAPPDAHGRLSGDLVLVGRGDPNLSGRALPFNVKTERPLSPTHVFEELADQVVAKGVKVIDGDVVADDSFFSYEHYGQGWAQEDLMWEYGAPVSALAVNDNVVYVNILPGVRVGERAFISVSPFVSEASYRFENRVVTVAAGSGSRRISIQREPGSRRMQLWGSIPLDDAGTSEALAADEPAEFCARLMAELLARRGVIVYGHTRAHHRRAVGEVVDPAELESAAAGARVSASAPPVAGAANGPAAATLAPATPAPATPAPVVLAEHDSQPLGMDIRVINKVSQNLHAEMLLRLVGHEKGSGGSVAGGLGAMRGFLGQAGILPEEYALYDGSGLSRLDLISPVAMVKLLRYAARQPWGAQFQDSLPLAGVDGTLASRFKNLTPGSVLRAKTGSLDHVNVLSGYLRTSAGHRLVFSIMANNHTFPGKQATDVIDAIVAETEREAN